MKERRPPKLANRLLRWFCNPDLLECIQGDLEEQFERSEMARWKRNAHYWYQVFNLFRPFAFKKWRLFHNNFSTLLRLNFVVTFRSIKRSPLFTTLNVLGLGIGLFACLLITGYVTQQLSYDKFHDDYQNSYRITHTIKESDKSLEKIATISRIAEELSLNYPSVTEVCRLSPLKGTIVVERGSGTFMEKKVYAVDSSFFQLFNFPFLFGSPESALNAPRSIVITKRVYDKLFNEGENPIGQEVIIDGALGFWSSQGYNSRLTYQVMGVTENLPLNTHLDFDYLISFNTYPELERELKNWGRGFHTYFKLDNSQNLQTLTTDLPAIAKKYMGDQNVELGIQAMQSIHLSSNREDELKSNGSKKSIWLLSGVTLILLLIAGTNYINFATARAISRQKEIWIRKIFWAKKSQLFSQLMTEAFVMNILSLGLAILLIPILNPLTTALTGFSLMNHSLSSEFVISSIVLFLLVVLFSGIYPALHISKLDTSGVIKGSMNSSVSKSNGRKFLVAFQFAVAVLSTGFSVVLFSQMDYISDKELGINIDKTIMVNGPTVGIENDSTFNRSMAYFKEEAKKLSNIGDVTLANFIPGRTIRGLADGYVRKVGTPESDANSYYFTQVDHQFFDAMKVSLLAGEFFDPAMGAPRLSIVINHEAAAQLGFQKPEEAIGQKIVYRMGRTPTIIGVVDNFHQHSLKRDFQPIIFEVRDAPDKYCYLKIESDDDLSQLITLQDIWEKTFPGNPFNFFFLEDSYANQYQGEDRFIKTFGLFSILAIFISTLGILGLASYIAKSSEKEIGIRKTLGANFLHINSVVMRRFGFYVILACLLTVPFVYLLGDNWLNSFVFRIEIVWWMLVLPILLLSITFLSAVSSQSLKAYLQNPVESLGSE